MTNVSKLPTPGVVLDLDAEERPAAEVKPPFIVTVGERVLTLADPGELDWKDLASVEIPSDLLRIAMSQEDRQHLFKQALPGWKFNILMESYYNHYDLEDKIRQAKRQQALGGL